VHTQLFMPSLKGLKEYSVTIIQSSFMFYSI